MKRFVYALVVTMATSSPAFAQQSDNGNPSKNYVDSMLGTVQTTLNTHSSMLSTLTGLNPSTGLPALSGNPIPMETVLSLYQTPAEAAANDDAPAMVRLQNIWRAQFGAAPLAVQFRQGTTYQFLSPLEIFTPIALLGLANLEIPGVFNPTIAAPRLFFPNGIGVRTWYVGSYQPNLLVGSQIRMAGLWIDGPGQLSGMGTLYDHHGITLKSQYDIQNLYVSNWGADGINADTSLSLGPITDTIIVTNHVPPSSLSMTLAGSTINFQAGGDHLTVLTVTVGHIITLTLNGSGTPVAVSYTVVAGDTSTSILATHIAGAVNAQSGTSGVTAFASSSSVILNATANGNSFTDVLSGTGAADVSLTRGADTATLNTIANAINVVFTGINVSNGFPCAYMSAWSLTVEDTEPSTTYTTIVNGNSTVVTTPVDPGNAPATLSAYALVNNTLAAGGFNGLVNVINAAVPASVTTVGYDVVTFNSVNTGIALQNNSKLSLAALNIQTVPGLPVNAIGYFSITVPTQLKLKAYSSTSNSAAHRIHVFNSGRHGIHIRGNDAGQANWYQADQQFNAQVGILDASLIGAVFFGVHINSNTNSQSVPLATGAGGTVFFAPYVEGGGSIGSFFGPGTVSFGGKPAIGAGIGGSTFNQSTSGVLDAANAVRGHSAVSGGNNNYAYVGDPSNTTSMFGYGSTAYSGGGTNDLHIWRDTGTFNANFLEHSIGLGASATVFEAETDPLNVRQGPGQKNFLRGLRYGGWNETSIQGLGTTPVRRMYSVTNGSSPAPLDCNVWLEPAGTVSSVSLANPPVVATSFDAAHTPQTGQRVWIESANGVTGGIGSINSQWRVGTTTPPGSFAILLWDGTNPGAFATGTDGVSGIASIARFECWTNATVTTPATIQAGASGGRWASGDLLLNSTPGPGQPRYWVVQTSGLGSSAVWTADNQAAWQPSTVALSNFPAGGSIGTAATTVDIASVATVNQTTAAQTITIPSPTTTPASRAFDLINIGTTAVTAQAAAGGGASTSVGNGTHHLFFWDSTTWRP